MRRRKYEDDEISTYHREALDFMNFEFSAIEDFELLCKVRNITIAEDIRSVISFFLEYQFSTQPTSLIALYEMSFECKEKFQNINLSTIFDYTVYRFQMYYTVLREGGFLNNGSQGTQ